MSRPRKPEPPATHPAQPADDTGLIAAGRHLELRHRGGWEFAARTTATGVVVIVATTDAGELLLTEQYRPPVASRVIDLPAGLAGDLHDDPAESLETAARRELLEETGYAAESLQLLGSGPSSAGLTSEILTFFLASGATRQGPGGGDASEDIRVLKVPVDGIMTALNQLAGDNTLLDPKIFAGLWLRQTALATTR